MIKLFFTILGMFLFVSNVDAQTEKIIWQTDYQEAVRLARQSDKPILIDFWAKWCEPCRVLDETFWVRSDVVEAAKKFVPLKVDYDAQRDLAKQFFVKGLPYVAFADSFGSFADFRGGFGAFTAKDITQIADQIPKDSKTLNQPFNRLETNPSDAKALLEIADFYAANNLPAAAAKFYELAYRTAEVRQNAVKKESVLANAGRQNYAAGNFQLAIYTLEDYLKFSPDGANLEDVYANLIAASVKLGKLTEAGKYLERLKTKFPASKKIVGAAKQIEQAKKDKVKSVEQ